MHRSFFALLLIPAGLLAQDLKPVALPAPETSGGKPLMQALKERKSTREFSSEKLSPQMLSNLLWAGWGINREDGRRTAPSASNRQEVDIYAVMADGAYVYDAKGNALKPVASGDLRKLTGTVAFVAEAPLNLVYVADFAKMGNGDENGKNATSNANAGFIAQNVYLFCASEGLGAVVRGSVSKAELTKALNLRPDQRILFAQTVGHVKK
jgi:nitroreductase